MNRSRSEFAFLILIWVVVSALNFGKAYHIDDTFHLIAAQHIREHPMAPMSGWVNWRNDPVPMYTGAHPPLFYYLIALFSSVFGQSELAMHAFMSLFTFAAMWAFREALRVLHVKREMAALVLFAFYPAFVAGQNLMMDVPLVALLLIIFLLFVRAVQGGLLRQHITLAAMLSIAMMMKYSVLPILLLQPLVLLLQRNYKALPALLVPLVLMGSWSLWNIGEFGFVHLLAKSHREFAPIQISAFLACCGALSTTTLLFIEAKRMKPLVRALSIGGPVAVVCIGLLVWTGEMTEFVATGYLQTLFLINGAALLVLVIGHFISTTGFSVQAMRDPRAIAFMFASSIACFILLFADFIAARHFLLIYPFLLLMGARMIDTADVRILRMAIAKALVLGIVLGISDLCYANYYRDMARSEDVQGGKTTWTVGHWGWQWYAEQVGMRSFGTTTSRIANGDLLIMPMNIDRQRLELPFDVDLHVVDKRWRGSDARTFVSVKNFASLYNSSVTKPVWNFSRLPIDTIYVYRIDIGREAAIRKAVRAILSDKDWSRIVREKARSANVPVDTMLRRDAIFVLAQDHPQGHEGNR